MKDGIIWPPRCLFARCVSLLKFPWYPSGQGRLLILLAWSNSSSGSSILSISIPFPHFNKNIWGFCCLFSAPHVNSHIVFFLIVIFCNSSENAPYNNKLREKCWCKLIQIQDFNVLKLSVCKIWRDWKHYVNMGSLSHFFQKKKRVGIALLVPFSWTVNENAEQFQTHARWKLNNILACMTPRYCAKRMHRSYN